MYAMNLENETKVWVRISQLVNESLSRYTTSLQEDQEMLEKDDKEHNLSYNERNCILFRMGEKEILEFLKTCSERFQKLFTLT
jgi:histone-lysine N-methyltransferase SETD3